MQGMTDDALTQLGEEMRTLGMRLGEWIDQIAVPAIETFWRRIGEMLPDSYTHLRRHRLHAAKRRARLSTQRRTRR